MRNGLKGAIAHGYIYVLIAICLAVLPQPASTSVTLVDYEKNDCTKSFQVNDINVYQVQSYPRQGVNTGRDRCYNQFVGFNNKKLKIHVYEVKIGSCGIFLNIFDGDEKMLNDPRWVLGCRGAEKTVYESYTSEVIVRLDKPSSDSSSLYSFRIYITNEDGPAVDLSDPPSMSDGGASSGVLVGVGIGVGLVVVVIVIVVAIVCWRMMNKKEKYANKNPAVFTTSASNEPPVNGILKRTESKGRGSKRRNNRPAYGGHDNKAYRGSVDGDDYSSVNGAPSTESTRGGIDLQYEEEVARKEGRPYSHRHGRRRNDDSTSDDTADSVFHTNKAFVDDERGDRSLRVRPDRRYRDHRDDSSDSYVSSSRGAVSYITDTTMRTRTDSPSRSTDDRGSLSSTTDGTQDRHFIKGDNARRSGRSRSHSKSSTQSGQRRRPRVSHSTGDQSDGSSSHRSSQQRPSSGGSHRRRSRSREREKKPSPYIGVFDDAKKKKRRK
ncbi:uncharacterized protein LOC117330303 isoform X2 [Pecten maximus]|uniref:uncharacterized protein LOC117330303 isoform X2 n=1 Tax=Pecten maximus TaxID=6579 RepID=UPI001458F570|nr:uncharacterized protein LOC117330303 isoform X2 [Pecten maximus]